ncbi:hypothetical protein [Novosphingobium sp.]|uniref:hypothetical protein n=1 Tax=Novosphingobium sp. TaxID=1874826 RepID=UPI003340C5D6
MVKWLRRGEWIRSLGLACATLAIMLPAAADAGATPAPVPATLPDRLLTCLVGHVTNFDPHLAQRPDQLRFDSHHVFTLFLPSIPVLVGRPPDAAEKAPPVDPRTRIISDPDHISGQPDGHFGRIVDLWPERTELSATIEGPLLNLIVINPIDTATGTANLFMLRATELTHYQQDHIYQGTCHILQGEAARQALTPVA